MRQDVTKTDPDGCFQRALLDEPVFTLLARDPQAPQLVRKWAADREGSGMPDPIWHAGDSASVGHWEQPSHPDAEQIAHARYVAACMEVWRYENDGVWRDKQ